MLGLTARSLRPQWCVIELFAFREMNADAGRLQILDFDGTLPYTQEGVALDSSAEPTEHSAWGPSARERNHHGNAHQQVRSPIRRNSRRSDASVGQAPSVVMQRFDVRHATCVGKGDKDALLAAIESCGSDGFETFNDWMHDMLVRHCSPPDQRASRRSIGSARAPAELAIVARGRSSFFKLAYAMPSHIMSKQGPWTRSAVVVPLSGVVPLRQEHKIDSETETRDTMSMGNGTPAD